VDAVPVQRVGGDQPATGRSEGAEGESTVPARYGIAGPLDGSGLLPWSWAEQRLASSQDY